MLEVLSLSPKVNLVVMSYLASLLVSNDDFLLQCLIKWCSSVIIKNRVTFVTFLHQLYSSTLCFITARSSSALSRGPSTDRQRGLLQKRPSIICSQLVLMPLIGAFERCYRSNHTSSAVHH